MAGGSKAPPGGDSPVSCAYCLEEDAEFNVESTAMDDEASAPMCGWCEGRSRNQAFESFREKRRFILDERRKSRRAVNSWTQQEIDELGPSMRAFIINAQHEEKRRRVTNILKSRATSRRILEMLLEEFPELRSEFGSPEGVSLPPVQVGRPLTFKEPRTSPAPPKKPSAPATPSVVKKAPPVLPAVPSRSSSQPVAQLPSLPTSPVKVPPFKVPAASSPAMPAVAPAPMQTDGPAPSTGAPAPGLFAGIRQLFQRRKPDVPAPPTPAVPAQVIPPRSSSLATPSARPSARSIGEETGLYPFKQNSVPQAAKIPVPAPKPVAPQSRSPLNRWWVAVLETGNWELVAENTRGAFFRIEVEFPQDPLCWETTKNGPDFSRPRRPQDMSGLVADFWLRPDLWSPCAKPAYVVETRQRANIAIPQGWAPVTAFLDDSELEQVRASRTTNPWLIPNPALSRALVDWRRLLSPTPATSSVQLLESEPPEADDEAAIFEPPSVAADLPDAVLAAETSFDGYGTAEELTSEDEQDLAWLAAFDDALDDSGAAAALNVPVSEFTKWRELNGIPARHGRTVGQDKDLERMAAYEETSSDDDASARLGIHPGTFAAWRKAHGLAAKKKKRERVDLSGIDDMVWMQVYESARSDVEAANRLSTTVTQFVTWRRAHGLTAKRWDGLSDEEDARYQTAYDGTDSDLAASKVAGVSYQRFNTWRSKKGLSAKGSRPVPIDHDARMKAYEDTNSDREAADQLGISVQAFKTWRRTLELPSQGGAIRDGQGRAPLKSDRDRRYFEAYLTGGADKDLGPELGTSELAFGRWRSRLGLPSNHHGKCKFTGEGIDLRNGDVIGRKPI